MRSLSMRTLAAGLGLLVAGVVSARAEGLDKMKVGEMTPYSLEVRNYGHGDTQVLTYPGAKFLRVQFAGFHVPNGHYVTVSNPDRTESWVYEGKGARGVGAFLSFAVSGDTAVVEIHGNSKAAGAEHGYRVVALGVGTVELDGTKKKGEGNLEVVCGTDGREDVACHLPQVDVAQRPVARLLFTSGGSQYLCTGWLVSGSNANTMLTNNHCFTTQTEVNSLQAKFNYQQTTCGGGATATTTDYAGGTFLKTNSVNKKGSKGGLDYTIFTLQGNPEATWGELVATTKSVNVGDLIWFIQHPGGRQKEIGYWEDDAHTVRCKVDTINQTYSRSATGSQTGYGCDSEGGASGSPIVDPASGHAVALHHFGGVTTSPCLNSGTAMAKVCADAGSLLSCVSN